MLCSLGGQPIFGRTLNRPSLLTRSNAFVRSTRSDVHGHLLFSALLVAVEEKNIMSIVDRSVRVDMLLQLLEAYQYDPSKYFADNAD